MPIIPYAELHSRFQAILVARGFSANKAAQCATVFADNSLDGVYSHGVNRFPKFVEMVQDGFIAPDAEPACITQSGALEQWDGNLGPGPLNALACADRAVKLAEANGIGCVALSNTNHWMRGGTYGWQAATKGFAFICFTNTIANMPAWGAVDQRIGNNPLIIAVPHQDGAIVLDMAMSQFSYGAMEKYDLQKASLPVFGGYNKQGNLTNNPGEILESQRTLPIGYWKGAGLSLLLDLLATLLSGGKSTFEISKNAVEAGLSQVFIAIKILNQQQRIYQLIESIIQDYHASNTAGGPPVQYPGERVLKTRIYNAQNGIPVDDQVWSKIRAL